MPSKSIKPFYTEIIRLYQAGLSGKEISDKLGFNHSNSIRQVLKKRGILRSQSDASSLAILKGKKNKIIKILTQLAKTTNRYNPLKTPWSGIPELHPNWKKDRLKLKNKRCITEERLFFKKLIDKRKYQCELTGKNGTLSVHHIKGVWRYPDLKYDEKNCIVVLKKIHLQFHNVYGNRTDESDWDEFVQNKEYQKILVAKKRNFVPFDDKKNKRFGRLIVLYKNHKTWHCKCDCGNETDVNSSDLNSGHTTSCGCYMRECNRKRLLNSKIWELSSANKK